MSLLSPVIPSAAAAQPRDSMTMVAAAAQRSAPAVSATLTQTAVQQIKASTRAELLSTRDLLPVTDKRDRLVGPPPTFEVNLLQHIRETRNEPSDVAGSERPQGMEAREDGHATPEKSDAPNPVNTTYGLLQSAGTAESTENRMNARF